MPVLFAGHGSPMNAIEDNPVSAGWRAMGQSIETPAAILCVSAHWETSGTRVTAMDRPRTIHDFRGFPPELSRFQYPAPGSPALAAEAVRLLASAAAQPDHDWGLDHGTWSVLAHLFPDARVPVFQLSLDRGLSPQRHYELARELAPLRDRGVLVLGSGNIVHNLGLLAWHEPAGAHDWALEARDALVRRIVDGDHAALMDYAALGSAVRLAIPTPEHFLPLLYVLALLRPGERPALFNDSPAYGSIAMTSLISSREDPAGAHERTTG